MYFTASPVVPEDDCVPARCFIPGSGVVTHQPAWASLLIQPLRSLGCWRCKGSHMCSSLKAHRCPHGYLGSSNQTWPVQSHPHVTASVSGQTHSMISSCFVHPISGEAHPSLTYQTATLPSSRLYLQNLEPQSVSR